jgi:hypothetical protein
MTFTSTTDPNDTRCREKACKDEHARFVSAFLHQVRRDPELPGNAFKVASVLAEHLNRKLLIAWPSQTRLADHTGLSESSVKRSIAALRRRGYLDLEPGGGCGRSSRYRLLIVDEPAAQTGPEMNPFITAERGSDQAAKGVQYGPKRGSVLDPDLLNTSGDANASPREKERENAHARATYRPDAGGPCGPAAGREGETIKPEILTPADGFRALRQTWVRPWADHDDREAMRAYRAVAAGTGHEAIIAAAESWVAAADPPRFLMKLSRWLSERFWERDPPQPQRRREARGRSRSRSKANVVGVRAAMAMGGFQPGDRLMTAWGEPQ